MNTTELITALKIRGSWPTSQDLFSTSDFLVLFNMQMQTEIVPLMMKLNEEFFLLTKEHAISSGSTHHIPARAIGAKLRDLQLIDAGGNHTAIYRLFEEDRSKEKSGYYLTRNSVELSDDYSSGTLRMSFFGRPNKLVETTSCAQITEITDTTNCVVSSVPSSFTTGVLCDFVQNNNPFDLLSYDQAIAGVSGTTLTFSSFPSDLAVGDWVCLAKEAPVPMVPEEVHPVLVQSALVATLSSKKDKALDVEMKLLEKMKFDVLNMLDPRVENDSVKFRSGRLMNYFATRW